MHDSRSRNCYAICSSDRLQSACTTSALKISTSSRGLRPAARLRPAAAVQLPCPAIAAASGGRNLSHATTCASVTSSDQTTPSGPSVTPSTNPPP